MTQNWLVSATPTAMGSGILEGAFERALDFAAHTGVRVPETGRHRTALKLLKRFNSGTFSVRSADEQMLRRLSAAHRTAWEALLILCAASLRRRSRATPFSVDKLQTMMGGGELIEGRDTRARDAQFELYIAALLALSGVEVRAGQPDVRFRYGYELVGVEAKRIRSTEPLQVRRNLTTAVEQIERSGLRGWIAVNLDSRFTTIQPGRRGQRSLLKAFNDAFDSVNAAVQPYEGNRRVLGVMLYGYVAQWIKSSKKSPLPQLAASSPFRWLGWVIDPGERLLYNDFILAWHGRLLNRFERMAQGYLECS